MQGAIAHYRFEQNGIDEFLAYKMSVTGADYATGRDGYAIQFDTSGEWAGSSGIGTDDITISFWIKPSTIGADGDIMGIACHASESSAHLLLYNVTNTVYFAYFDINTFTVYGGTATSITKDTWYHVLVENKKNQYMKFYINNSLSTNFTADLIDNSAFPFSQIGRAEVAATIYQYYGLIDSMVVCNKILSDNEKLSLYKEQSLEKLQKNSKMKVFRRLWMKRRETSGEYETSWQEIPNSYVKSWGSISYELDNMVPAFFKQSQLDIELVNIDGYFSPISERKSFFYGKLTIPRTLIKIEAGYIDQYGVEHDINSTVYIGIITDDISYNNTASVKFGTKNLQSIFDFPASKIGLVGITTGALYSYRAIEIIRDYVDSNAVAIFQKYIPYDGWNIQTITTSFLPTTTSQIDNMTCWDLMSKLAGAGQAVIRVDGRGQFHFESAAQDDDIKYYFDGILYPRNHSRPINIMENFSISDNISEVYNRIKVKYRNADTTTSYKLYDTDWNWGESNSAFYYGTREYTLENNFISPNNASIMAAAIYAEYAWPKKKVEFDAIFVPQLELQNKIQLTYQTKLYADDSTLWNHFLWGKANWMGRLGFNINIYKQDFIIKQISHDLNDFKTNITARERGW